VRQRRVSRMRVLSGRSHAQIGAQSGKATRSSASGFAPTPESELKFRGEQTVAYLKYPNRFVGTRACWQPDCVDSIGSAQARPDRGLNGFIRGHFPD
jgi:hypothetical protein